MILSRYFVLLLITTLTLAFAILGLLIDPWWAAPLLLLAPLLTLGAVDLVQTSHAILRNFEPAFI
jgi:hypothetical protein